ncbi:hypothetical protein N9L47_08940 [Rhodobacteraceae bacterium]|nr:hypothetical protein [Paracoccaceae bacterium]
MSALPQDAIKNADVPVVVDHLLSQTCDLGADPVAFYLQHGLECRLNPTPWFVTDWYAWQNPDWTTFAAPYLHYLDKGRFEGRDPSPFVDIPRYRDVSGVSPGAIYDLILAGHRSIALGVYGGRADLTRCQQNFRDGIQIVAHQTTPPVHPKKALVVLQAGREALSHTWFDNENREWDLLVNYYDAAGHQPGLGDYVFFQKGTKFTAMWLLWNRFRNILSQYEHVIFLDDDVETTCDGLNRLFRTCRTHDLDLAQMALTSASSCNWTELFAQSGHAGPRNVSAVEIMMPVFSKSALRNVAPTFDKSVSGFGLDLAWGKIVSDAGGKIAVLDDVLATHARPVDQTGGAYYSYLRRHMINAKSELWTLLEDYDADRNLISF